MDGIRVIRICERCGHRMSWHIDDRYGYIRSFKMCDGKWLCIRCYNERKELLKNFYGGAEVEENGTDMDV